MKDHSDLGYSDNLVWCIVYMGAGSMFLVCEAPVKGWEWQVVKLLIRNWSNKAGGL